MIAYIQKVKQQFRDVYKFVPTGGTESEPMFGNIPSGQYPMWIDGKLDNVVISGDNISVGNFYSETPTKYTDRDSAANDFITHLDSDSKEWADECFCNGWNACIASHHPQAPKRDEVANEQYNAGIDSLVPNGWQQKLHDYIADELGVVPLNDQLADIMDIILPKRFPYKPYQSLPPAADKEVEINFGEPSVSYSYGIGTKVEIYKGKGEIIEIDRKRGKSCIRVKWEDGRERDWYSEINLGLDNASLATPSGIEVDEKELYQWIAKNRSYLPDVATVDCVLEYLRTLHSAGEVNSFAAIMKKFTDFSLVTFKDATAFISLKKLEAEIWEVKGAMDNDVFGHYDKSELATEYADCIMCLMDSAARCDISGKELQDALEAKIDKNIGRTWKQNPDGTYSHLPHPPAGDKKE